MKTLDIELPQMALLYGLCLLPGLLLWLIGLRLSRDIGISILRMSIQLALVGIYLKMLFDLNHPWLNGLWILMMLLVADVSILRRAGLKVRYFALATFTAIASSILFSTAYLVILVIQPTHFYDARYIVPLAGMILGNCLQGNVIALERFYSAATQERERIHDLSNAGCDTLGSRAPLLSRCRQSRDQSDHRQHGYHGTGIAARHDDGANSGWQRTLASCEIPNRYHDLYFHQHHHRQHHQLETQPEYCLQRV